MASAEELRSRLQSLPQEIFDDIYDITFTATPTCPHVASCTKELRSEQLKPTLLQVNRASRHKFATSFYGCTPFMFHDIQDAIAWVQTLPKAHVSMLKTLLFLGNLTPGDNEPYNSYLTGDLLAEVEAKSAVMLLLDAEEQLHDSGITLGGGVLRINVRPLCLGTDIWTSEPTTELLLYGGPTLVVQA